MYYQDDGNRAIYYAPYSANTGFYYIRNNVRTQHFFNTLLLRGDMIVATKSHQAPLISLLSEHSSLYGLKIKILSRDEDDFPGGHAYHRRKGYMKELMQINAKKYHNPNISSSMNRNNKNTNAKTNINMPYMFHMSWTVNKKAKLKYYQQMGEWYLRQECIQKIVPELEKLDTTKTTADKDNNNNFLFQHCCMVEPQVECHYRDKPSIIPCHDSPPIDKGRPTWWK